MRNGILVVFSSFIAACTGGGGASGDVTVLLTDFYGRPAAGADVLFHDAGGALLTHVRTSADGIATASIPDGGGVTFGDPATIQSVRGIQTIIGLRPGDTIESMVLTDAPAPPPLGTAIVALPGSFAGAVRYDMRLGCTLVLSVSTASAATTTVPANCDRDGNSSITYVASAYDAADNRIAFSTATVPLASLGTQTTLPAWRADLVEYTVTSNLPYSVYTGFAVWLLGGDGPYYSDSTYGSSDQDSLTVRLPRLDNMDVFRFARASGYGVIRIRSALTATNEMIDFSNALPAIDSVVRNGTCLEYVAPDAASQADAMTATFSRFDISPETHWNLWVEPSSDGTVCMPEIPDGVSWWPQPADAGQAHIGFIDYESKNGWADVRMLDVEPLQSARLMTRSAD